MTVPVWAFWIFTILGAIGSLSSVGGFIIAVRVLRSEHTIQNEVETLAHDEANYHGGKKINL